MTRSGFLASTARSVITKPLPAGMPPMVAWTATPPGSEPDFFGLPDLVEEVEGLVDEALTSDCGVGDEYVQVSKRALNQLMEAVGSNRRVE